MRFRLSAILVLALLCLAPTVSLADLAPYSQDFEGLLDTTADQPDQLALNHDGWLAFVNGFGPDWSYWYSYGPFPAPNGGFGGPAFSAVVIGEGDAAQGAQQLSIYSDYNNNNHRDGTNAIIESNVFQEQIVGAADVGSTWFFEFDAKRGNIEGISSAAAFIKTLDPNNNYALTNFITIDMTFITPDWASYSMSIYIDPSLAGQILQIGFVNWASNSEGSGIFYDNVDFATVGACCTPLDCTELRVTECVGQYSGDGTTCSEGACEGPLFFTVCHIPPGNFGNAHTITVGYAAAQAHLAHGDSPGQCGLFDPNQSSSLGGLGFQGASHIQQVSGSMQQSEEVRPWRRSGAKSKLEGTRSRGE